MEAFERTGVDDVSGERVSVDLYEKVHTIARLAAALQAQVLQADEGRAGGGSVSAPSASAAAEHSEVRAKVSSLGEFESYDNRSYDICALV